MSFMDLAVAVTQRDSAKAQAIAKKERDKRRLESLKVRMYDSADPNEGWYVPKNESREEMIKCQIIREKYFMNKVELEPDPHKKYIMKRLMENGIYDFEGL